MGRKGITESQVFTAASKLYGTGVKPTISLVRNVLGNTGSSSTISKYLQAWKAEFLNSDVEGLPVEWVESLRTIYESVKLEGQEEIKLAKNSYDEILYEKNKIISDEVEKNSLLLEKLRHLTKEKSIRLSLESKLDKSSKKLIQKSEKLASTKEFILHLTKEIQQYKLELKSAGLSMDKLKDTKIKLTNSTQQNSYLEAELIQSRADLLSTHKNNRDIESLFLSEKKYLSREKKLSNQRKLKLEMCLFELNDFKRENKSLISQLQSKKKFRRMPKRKNKIC